MNKQLSSTDTYAAYSDSNVQMHVVKLSKASPKQKMALVTDSFSANFSQTVYRQNNTVRNINPIKFADSNTFESSNYNSAAQNHDADELTNTSNKERLIYQLLNLSFSPLPEFITHAASLITKLECLHLLPAWDIYLSRPNGESQAMDRISSHKLIATTSTPCHHITPDTCLCAQAASRPIKAGPLSVPIMMNEKMLGVMTFYMRSDDQANDETRNFLSKIANILAVGIMKYRAEEKIAHLTYHHTESNLPNRLMFTEHLQALITNKPSQTKYALLYINLDRFNTVNDLFGHSIGDNVLLDFADKLSQIMTKNDFLAHLGGDEFAILINHNSANKLIKIARRKFQRIADLISCGFSVQGHSVKIGVSAGLLVLNADEHDTDDCLQKAKIALYRAKQRSGNTLSLFKPETQLRFQQQLTLEHNLRQALIKNEMALFYQPQFNNQKQIIAAEALLRWESENGLIMPNDFLHLAEQTGIITDIGYWAIEQVCKKIVQWKDNKTLKHIAVNVSAIQFQLPDFIAKVDQILARTGANPNKLMLEITESTLADQTGETHQKITQLKQLGVKISIDDFGTGYSSLAYLKHFAVDQIKIDKDFIKHIDSEIKDQVIVKAVSAIADSMQSDLIAEGVETKKQFDYLNQSGCTQYQGFYFEKPISADSFYSKYIQ